MRILLADDDPLNRGFLADWLRSRGVVVEAVDSLAGFTERAADGHDWWLLDRWLGDGDSLSWLAGQASPRPRAGIVLISGEATVSLPDGIHLLPKPVAIERLAALLGIAAGPPTEGTGVAESDADLDDALALRALNGVRSALAPLRAMLRAELLAAHWLHALPADPGPALLSEIHRLRGACALVGCPRLGAALERVERCWRGGQTVDASLARELALARTRLLDLLPRQA